jgi:hypothetical protein
MAGTLLPVARQQFLDADGNPLAGGKLYSRESGSVTPSPTYSDPDLAVIHENTNPIILDAGGFAPDMYIGAVALELELTDANDVTQWTVPYVPSTALSDQGIGVAVFNFGGDASSPIPAAQVAYPSGTGYDKCHAGSGIWNLDSANLVGSYVLQAMLMVLTPGTVTLALVNLTDGSPDVALVTVASSSVTGERKISVAIPFAAGGAAKDYAIKVKTSGVVGFAWMAQVIRES